MADLPAPLAAALAEVAAAMLPARDEWWLIGSAAMALHGADVEVADVDLVTSVADAERLFGDVVHPGTASDRFRSDRFGHWATAGLTVEVMAGLEVQVGGSWQPVAVPARMPMRLGDTLVFTPGVEGLLSMCRLFDRPKDRVRAALLERLL